MKVGELFLGKPGKIDPRLIGQCHKSTVAAGKKPRLELGVIGISIGQEQSTGDTSRVSEAVLGPRKESKTLGARVPFTSYREWKRALPKNTSFKHDVTSKNDKLDSIEYAQSFTQDFEGRSGAFNHDTSEGWIYKHYLDSK